MKVGYYAVEVGAAICIPFVLRNRTAGWGLAALVSIGPFIAYILSRSVGLPGDPGDVGNWGYTLGTVSLAVEGALFVLSTTCLLRASPPGAGPEPAAPADQRAVRSKTTRSSSRPCSLMARRVTAAFCPAGRGPRPGR